MHTLVGSQRGEVTSGLQSGALFPEGFWELDLPVFMGRVGFTMVVNHKYAKWDTLGYSRFPSLPPLLWSSTVSLPPLPAPLSLESS